MAYVKKIWKDYPDTTAPIKAEDLNNIEDGLETVTDNVNNGWIELTGTFTYSSWDSTTKTGIVNSNLDLTPYLSVGMKVKFTQNATVKYGIITAITSTQITLFMGTDYTLLNAVISNAFYSMERSPYEFPMNEDKWSIIVNDTSLRSQISPVEGTWYNAGGMSITAGVGLWRISYNVAIAGQRGAAGDCNVQVALGLATNSALNQYRRTVIVTPVKQAGYFPVNMDGGILELSSQTTYYLNISAGTNGMTGIFMGNNLQTLALKVVCAYL